MFDAMLTNATRLCEAILGALYRYEGGLFHPAALTGAPPALADFIWQRGSFVPAVGAALDRLLQTKTVVHTLDQAEEQFPVLWAPLVGARGTAAGADASGNPKIAHHPALLMLDDVTVEHPVAGIVGHEGNFRFFLRQQ